MNKFLYNNNKHTITQITLFYANEEQNLKLNFDVSMKTDEIFKKMNQNKKIKNLNEILKN